MIDAIALVRDAVTAGDGSIRSGWRLLMTAMVQRLAPFAGELPPVGTDALRVAGDYWRRSAGDPADLLDAKVACWKYLDTKHGSGIPIVDREDRLLRGLLCVLEPGGDEEDMSDIAEWFAEMMNQATPGD